MGTKNQQSTVQQTVPDWLSGAYQNLIGQAQNTINTHPYQPYTGGFTSDQQQAFHNIAALNGTADPSFQAANSAYSGALNPTYNTVGNYMNPYVQNVVNATMANMNELNGQQQQQVLGNAIAKGAMGGNRVGVAQAELARQQNLANQQTIAGLWNDAYSNALGAAQNQQQVGLTAGAGLAGLGQTQMNTGLAQAGAQLGAGTQQQQFNYQQYLNQQGYPYQQLSWLSGVINGTGPNAGGTTTQTVPGGNIFGQLFGAGLGIASLFAKGGAVKDGGVFPYGEQSPFMQGSGVWPGYVLNGDMPYADDGGIFLPYIPQADEPTHYAHFPDPADMSTDDSDDTYGGVSTSTMRKGAETLAGLFHRANGGVIPHMAGGGGLSPQQVQDIYSGIIAPQGGLYQPGPPVMLPPVGMGNTMASADPIGDGTNWYQFDDFVNDPYNNPSRVQTAAVPGPGGFVAANKDQSRLPHGTLLAFNGDQNTGISANANGSASLRAINANMGGNNDLVYEPAVSSGVAPAGDAWAGMRGPGTYVPREGLVTAPAPSRAAATRPAAQTVADNHVGILGRLFGFTNGSSPGQRIINGLGSLFSHPATAPAAGVVPSAPRAVPAGNPGDSFLQAQGVDTSNMTAGQQADSLKKAMGMYAKGGRAIEGSVDWEHTGFDDLMPMLHQMGMHFDWKGRPQSSNIEDRTGRGIEGIIDSSPMNTSFFTHGEPALPHDHFTKGYAGGGTPKKKDDAVIPPPAATTVDAVNALDGDRLGLGAGNGVVTPDDAGLNQPPAYADAAPAGDNPFRGMTFDPGAYGNTVGVVPYTSGQAFETQDPQYSQNIGDAINSLRNGNGLNLSPDFRQALFTAGAGMMASRNPFFLGSVGEGALKGVEQWNKRQEVERENAKARADISQTGQQLAQSAFETAARIPLTQAQTAATRYTLTRTAGGVMVTDVFDPQHPKLVPWGGILPDGTTANPVTTGAPPLFSTEPPAGGQIDRRLMVPESTPQVMDEATMAIKDARAQQQASLSQQQLLTDMQHNLDQLPDDGWLSQGAGFQARLEWAKTVQAAANIAGIQVPDDFVKQVAAGEDVSKTTTRLGFELSKTLGSDNAASIVESAVGASPHGGNSKAGAERIIGALEAVNNRRIDYYNAMQKWAETHGGSIYGLDQWFNKVNPPELYALSAYVPKEAMERLAQHPEYRDWFNHLYGNGRDVAKYVLNRG